MEIELEISYFPHQLEVFFESNEKFIIVRKGRRVGLTRGAAHAFIEYSICGISPLLWVDTINGNIDRYYDRYFLPILKKLPESIKWNFNQQKRLLKINDSIIDFRSAEHPESIEGFGYRKIFLNEAGIILKDEYLYTNAILPMLLDFEDSQLIAAGVPKGKTIKNGQKHKFFELYENCLAGKRGYKLLTYSSYTNPTLKKEDIDSLINDMSPNEVNQEIFGEFTDFTGNNPFAFEYDPLKHESTDAVFDHNKELIISLDFNINPFSVIFAHLFKDEKGRESLYIFDEISVDNGSIPKMVEIIKSRYGNKLHHCRITGDAMGNRGDISQRDNATLYQQLLRGLGISNKQLMVSANPTHENSKADVNYVLRYMDNFKINPINCPLTCNDMRTVQVDAFGSIMKRNRNDLTQRADFLDAVRYLVNTFLKKWIINNNKFNKNN